MNNEGFDKHVVRRVTTMNKEEKYLREDEKYLKNCVHLYR
jgi:uncharacterized protein (UPF0335 family)